MRKEIFENLLIGSVGATSSDFSPEDKKRIFDVMSSKGMSDGTAYNRFFRDGFERWELKGIRRVISDFVSDNEMEPALLDDPASFYKKLDNKSQFKQYMNELGMCPTTATFRFSGFNFRQWELEGIEQVIEESFID